jgi:predicted TIM-barrel fold metal-dependent hydrolase
VVNPLLPWWEKDVEWAKQHERPAVWLFPNYWGLKLSDPPGERLLAALREAGLGLVVSARLNDERLLPPEFYRPSVPVTELAWIVRHWPDIPVMLVSTTWQEVQAIGAGAIRDSGAVIEISYMKQPTHLVEYLVQSIGADHVVFGSGIPLHYAEAASYRLEMAEISDSERAAVLGGTLASTFNLNLEGPAK